MIKKYLHQGKHMNQSILRQWKYKTHKKIKQNGKKKKKKLERERERERDNLFVWEKNMYKMGESDKFIVRG